MGSHAERGPNPWLVLLGLTLGVLVTNGFARFAYGLILPAMRSDLGWTYAQAGWLNTANALGYILGAVATMVAIRRISPSALFAAGLVATVVALLATGVLPALWWQSLWRFLAGATGALSFSTAGALAAGLWPGDARRNALGIAILFGTGGGLAILLAGGTIPAMLGAWGEGAWPWAWVGIGVASALCVPMGLWAARVTRVGVVPGTVPALLPLRAMLPQMAGYASFGLGYIVYLTFLSAFMVERGITGWQLALVWVVLGAFISASPFFWRGIFARHDGGRPLAMVLACIAAGSALPVVWSSVPGLVVSAMVFGGSVFMAPGAVTNFTRRNLPPQAWGRAIGLFTVVFAVAQTVGPYGAGLLGDMAGGIGVSLLAASGVLMAGALVALRQRPL
jgi:predicted MFS family arabinose efflux permease